MAASPSTTRTSRTWATGGKIRRFIRTHLRRASLPSGWASIVRLGWLSAPYWVLLAWSTALLGLFAIAYFARAGQARLTNPRLAGALEELGAWRHGTLTSLLDTAAAGTSGDLLSLAD